MKTSSNGRALIERYEGLILQSYDDANDHVVSAGGSSRGTLTIGYGHTSAAGAPKVVPGMKITKEQADAILASDLQKVEVDVAKLVKVPLTQNQFDALVSFHFNTGSLGKSTALKKLNAGDYQGCADALMMYTRGRVNGQLIPMKGLVTRRTEEKTLFMKKDTAPSKTGVGASTGAAGAVVVAGGTAVASTPQHYWPWIIVGTIVTAIVAFILFEVYEFNKKVTT